METIKIRVDYYAQIKEKSMRPYENWELAPNENLSDLYRKINLKYQVNLDAKYIRVAMNEEFCGMEIWRGY